MTLRVLLATVLFAAGCQLSDGSPPEIVTRRQPVIGGLRDDARPNVVAIVIEPAHNTGIGFCSGFVIAPNLVLTARHCVGDLSGAGLVCADETVNGTALVANRASAPAPAQRFRVSEEADVNRGTPAWRNVVAVHVPAAADGQPNCGTDVALLELAAPLTGATPIAVRAAPVEPGESFTAVGYGYDGADLRSSGVRRSRNGLSVASVGLVQQANQTWATANDWIAALGPCGGDSGSPALDSAGQAIGVMSRGQPTICADMIYTSVVPFREWIKDEVRAAATRAGIPLVAWVDAETQRPDVTLPAVSEVQQPAVGCTHVPGAPGLFTLVAVGVARRGPSRRRRVCGARR